MAVSLLCQSRVGIAHHGRIPWFRPVYWLKITCRGCIPRAGGQCPPYDLNQTLTVLSFTPPGATLPAMTEFELIERCFGGWSLADPGLIVGQGDDCLVWQDSAPLAMSIDTAVAGRHFPENATAAQVAQRAFLPAVSDLAAMGAEPAFFTLALTLPKTVDDDWLLAFGRRLRELAEHWGLVLAGGDTTSGPVTVISVQVHGRVQQPLLRAKAQPGDDVWVSGQTGLAAAALPKVLDPTLPPVPEHWLAAYWQPVPRIELGQKLVGLATAAIDVSDGLAADLGHLAEASGVRIDVDCERLPMEPELQTRFGEEVWALVLAGGDDYELAFTAPVDHRDLVSTLGRSLALPLTRIGRVEAGDAGVQIRHNGRPLALRRQGFEHF